MIGDAGVDRGISDGLAMWIGAGDGWEAVSGRVGVWLWVWKWIEVVDQLYGMD